MKTNKTEIKNQKTSEKKREEKKKKQHEPENAWNNWWRLIQHQHVSHVISELQLNVIIVKRSILHTHMQTGALRIIYIHMYVYGYEPFIILTILLPHIVALRKCIGIHLVAHRQPLHHNYHYYYSHNQNCNSIVTKFFSAAWTLAYVCIRAVYVWQGFSLFVYVLAN